MKVVTGLFSNQDDAAEAITALKGIGIKQSTLTLISSADKESTYIRELVDEEPRKTAVTGAAAGGVLGSLLGLLGGIFLIPVPGIGPILASGMLTTASGGVLGGFLGSLYALRAESQPEIDIKEALAAGKMLLVVDASSAKSDDIKLVMESHNGQAVAIHESEIDPI